MLMSDQRWLQRGSIPKIAIEEQSECYACSLGTLTARLMPAASIIIGIEHSTLNEADGPKKGVAPVHQYLAHRHSKACPRTIAPRLNHEMQKNLQSTTLYLNLKKETSAGRSQDWWNYIPLVVYMPALFYVLVHCSIPGLHYSTMHS